MDEFERSLSSRLSEPLYRRIAVWSASTGGVIALVIVLAIQAGLMMIGGWPDQSPLAMACLTLSGVLLGALLGGLSGIWLASRVEKPLVLLTRFNQKVADGQSHLRINMVPADAIGRLARSIDDLLEERGAAQTLLSGENEELSDSVVEIMRAIGEIASTKDLGIKVPITENVTGAIAEAVNLLTAETARVLTNVLTVSRNVARATVAVKRQSDQAHHAAQLEQREVGLAARELARAALSLDVIARQARECDLAAVRAVEATSDAVGSVSGTVRGIADSRQLIHETEKRIKLLGERSQEIGQVVGMIESVAARTGLLALNASMHAAAAGEAGRRFASVADEIKRLSESAHDATRQIARLVNAIQTETGETVRAMNQAIGQVVEINRLADEAGRAMRRNQEETGALVATVREIAQTSAEQASIGTAFQDRARIIREASDETGRQLNAQTAETRRLVEYARSLMDEVSVFKLPAVARKASAVTPDGGPSSPGAGGSSPGASGSSPVPGGS